MMLLDGMLFSLGGKVSNVSGKSMFMVCPLYTVLGMLRDL